MESLTPTSPDASNEDAMYSSVTDHADTHSEGNITNIIATDAVSSCSTADDNSSAAEKYSLSLDPYSYVQRGDYTSEVFKLELMNLPRRFGIGVSRL